MAFNEYENMHSTIRTVDQLLEDIQDLDRAVSQYQWANEKQGDFIRKVYERLGLFQDEDEDEDVNVDACFNKALSELDSRLSYFEGTSQMPKVVDWPRFIDGSPVLFGDKIDGLREEVQTIVLFSDGCFGIGDDLDTESCECFDSGTRIKRPAPKVFDADGVEIHVGDTVWVVGDAWPSMKVLEIKPDDDPDVPEHLVWCGETCCEPLSDTKKWRIANQLTHRAPVLAADGKPLREGETVYHVADGRACVVREVREVGAVVEPVDGRPCGRCRADYLTHERLDSWGRLEDDASKSTCEYFDHQNYGCGSCPHYPSECQNDKARDLVRRAKALAERDA